MVQVEAAEIRVLFPIGVGRACRELPPPSDGRESEQFPCFFGGPISGGFDSQAGQDSRADDSDPDEGPCSWGLTAADGFLCGAMERHTLSSDGRDPGMVSPVGS
jgi:hypothetical protein